MWLATFSRGTMSGFALLSCVCFLVLGRRLFWLIGIAAQVRHDDAGHPESSVYGIPATRMGSTVTSKDTWGVHMAYLWTTHIPNLTVYPAGHPDHARGQRGDQRGPRRARSAIHGAPGHGALLGCVAHRAQLPALRVVRDLQGVRPHHGRAPAQQPLDAFRCCV